MRGVEQVKPTDAGRDGGDGGDPPRRKERAARRAGWPLAGAAILLLVGFWIGFGIHGLASYGHAYIKYRGFSPPKDARGVPRGRMVRFRFYSAALHRERSYDVYLPPGYARDAGAGMRFPVLYLLHGSPGRPSLLRNAGNLDVDVDNLLARHAIRPFLVVMPDGRDGTFLSDTEWADTRHGRYESFVLDVVHDADARLATIPRGSWRAIAGLSEGGYGAMNIALGHLRMFSVVESWSGYFRQSRRGVFRHASPGDLALNSPADYVMSLSPRLQRRPLRAFIYTGRHDELAPQGQAFSLELRRAGGHVRFQLVPGRHDWEVWRRMMPASLEFASRWFGAAR